MKRRITTDNTVNGQPIRADRDHPVIVDIIEGYQERLEYMLSRHGKVLVTQVVASFPAASVANNPNQAISHSMDKLRKQAKRENIEILYGWSREQSLGAPNPHYQIGIIADGDKTQQGYRWAKAINRIWARELGMAPESHPVHLCAADPGKFPGPEMEVTRKTHELKIVRNAADADSQRDNVINWLSYGAKTSQKGQAPKGEREYGFSQIPKTAGR